MSTKGILPIKSLWHTLKKGDEVSYSYVNRGHTVKYNRIVKYVDKKVIRFNDGAAVNFDLIQTYDIEMRKI